MNLGTLIIIKNSIPWQNKVIILLGTYLGICDISKWEVPTPYLHNNNQKLHIASPATITS